MKLYLVFHYIAYEGDTLKGVFSTFEKANTLANRLKHEHDTQYAKYNLSDDWNVVEYTLDKVPTY